MNETCVLKPKPAKKFRRANHINSSKVLSLTELLFINEYMKNGKNRLQAYRTVRPKTTYKSASVAASRLLDKPRVQQEISNRVQVENGISLEYIHALLVDRLALAQESKEADKIGRAIMDLYEAGGHKVNKVADVTDKDRDLVRQQVREHLNTITVN